MEQRSNKAGCFLLCSILNQEARRFNLIFPEGRGLSGGWETLANKLRSLGVGCFVLSGSGDIKLAPVHREKKPSYADAAKEHFGRAGDAVWLQLRDSETDSLERLEDHALVGRWSGGEESSVDWGSLRRWGLREWGLRGALRVSQLSIDQIGIILFFLWLM